MKKKYTIYKLINKTDEAILYVGLSTNVEQRLKGHKSASVSSNGELYKFIRGTGAEIGILEIETLEDCPLKQAKEREYYWVNKLKADGHNLFNVRTKLEVKTFSGKAILLRGLKKSTKNKLKRLAKSKRNGYINTEVLNAIDCYLDVCNHNGDITTTYKKPENTTP